MRLDMVVWMLALLAGCSDDKVGGTVDGEPVSGAKDAIFDRVEVLGVDVAVVWITDTPDSCAAFEDALSARSLRCDDTCEELGEAAEAWFTGEDFWTLNALVRVDGDLPGTYDHDNDTLPSEGRFTASYARWDTALWADYDASLDECQELDALTEADLTPAEDGELEVTEADDDTLRGTFSFEFDDDDALSGRFEATRCDMADWLL